MNDAPDMQRKEHIDSLFYIVLKLKYGFDVHCVMHKKFKTRR